MEKAAKGTKEHPVIMVCMDCGAEIAFNHKEAMPDKDMWCDSCCGDNLEEKTWTG